MSKKPNKYERNYFGLLAELPCVACGKFGVQIHHNTKHTGFGQRNNHDQVMPLCFEHHYDLHHGIGIPKWEEKYGDQDDLVKQVKLRVYADILQNDYPEFEAERIGKSVEEIENFILNNEV